MNNQEDSDVTQGLYANYFESVSVIILEITEVEIWVCDCFAG